MGTKANPAPNDCYEKALDDEPIFILLARDEDAPATIKFWADRREERKGPDDEKVLEAEICVYDMLEWKQLHPEI